MSESMPAQHLSLVTKLYKWPNGTAKTLCTNTVAALYISLV